MRSMSGFLLNINYIVNSNKLISYYMVYNLYLLINILTVVRTNCVCIVKIILFENRFRVNVMKNKFIYLRVYHTITAIVNTFVYITKIF